MLEDDEADGDIRMAAAQVLAQVWTVECALEDAGQPIPTAAPADDDEQLLASLK